MSGSNEEIVANIKANLANPQLQEGRALLNKERNESFDDFAKAVSPPKPVVLASSEEIARRFTVAEGDGARAAIENSRSLTAEQRFGASAILAAEAQAKSRDEELSKVTAVPTFDSTGAIAAPLTPTSTAKSTNEEIDNRAAAFTLSPETMKDINAAAKAESAQSELVKGINTNLESNTVTSTTAFSNNRRQGQSFNIGRFRAEVSSADSVLPTHSFLVVFAPMTWAIQKFPTSAGNLDSILTMRCDNVVLPSINLLQEQNIRRYGFGPVENVAYGVNVGDFTLQFIVDKNAFVVQFFEEWLNKIVNRDSFGGANMNNVLADDRRPYEIAYKDTYACSSINVFVYDRSQNNVMEYNIYDAFPTGIQSMNMSWSEENTLMKLNITFSFTDLRIKQSPAKNKQGAPFKDEIKVTATGKFAVNPFASGSTLTTLDSSGDIARRLTDFSNETVTIGDGFRTRGSPPPLPSATFQKAIVTDVDIPTSRNVFGTPLVNT